MFLTFWRKWWSRSPVLLSGKYPRGGRPPSCRPGVEALEDRALSSLWAGGFLPIPPLPSAVSGPYLTGSRPSAGPTPIPVTVDQNAADTVINLGPVFGALGGIRPGDGLKLVVLGNTNSGLVRTDL